MRQLLSVIKSKISGHFAFKREQKHKSNLIHAERAARRIIDLSKRKNPPVYMVDGIFTKSSFDNTHITMSNEGNLLYLNECIIGGGGARLDVTNVSYIRDYNRPLYEEALNIYLGKTNVRLFADPLYRAVFDFDRDPESDPYESIIKSLDALIENIKDVSIDQNLAVLYRGTKIFTLSVITGALFSLDNGKIGFLIYDSPFKHHKGIIKRAKKLFPKTFL